MKYNFTQALISNIERTFTYSYAKNAYSSKIKPEYFDSIEFFEECLKEEPFDALMALEGVAFKRAKNILDKFGIAYTEEQERRAKVYADVTEKMMRERSDYVSLFVENLHNTGVVKIAEPFVLTTTKTINVADFINFFPKEKITDNLIYEDDLPVQLVKSKEQYNAVKNCVRYHVSCLIGGAGTGKSFVTAQVIKQLQLNDLEVVVLAPTHKAREALQKKMKDNGVEGTVKTIHSYVHKPSECDAIVIDESGMLSTPLMDALRRVYGGEQLIFVGDKNQLPPVDYGRPFEKIQKKVMVSELKENHRSESADIVMLGREILGVPFNANMDLNNIEVVDNIESAFDRGAEVLLTYTNSDVKETNEAKRIKNGKNSISPLFSIGDKVIAKTNERGRFFNGQLFEVVDFNLLKNVETLEIVKIKSDKDFEYNFDLAYGLTIHKSQGSEWDIVAYKPSELDSQNLAYVAVTRAKRKLIIVGDKLKTLYKPEREWRQLYEVNCV